MLILNVNDKKDTKIESFPYKGRDLPVKNTCVRWLSQAGPPDMPEYGLRLFTIGPGGSIPIHNHLYYQTMYILEGRLRVTCYDPDTDEKREESEIGPHELVYFASMEPHSCENMSNTQKVTFLCCIANVYEEESL